MGWEWMRLAQVNALYAISEFLCWSEQDLGLLAPGYAFHNGTLDRGPIAMEPYGQSYSPNQKPGSYLGEP